MNENVWEIPAVLCFLWIGVSIAMMVTWCLMDADKRAFHRLLRFKGPSFMLWNMEHGTGVAGLYRPTSLR